jgi:hypothetical protein
LGKPNPALGRGKKASCFHHTATLLLNGNVLVAADYNGGSLASAELYDSANYSAQIQRPINADGTSVFTVKLGVVPVKFTLTLGGTIDTIPRNLLEPSRRDSSDDKLLPRIGFGAGEASSSLSTPKEIVSS